MNINTSMMSSSMSKTTGCGGGFLGKTGDEWADIGLTVGGAALATAGVIGIGSLIFDNFGGGGGSSSSSSSEKEDKILVVTQDGRVITAQPQKADPQIPAKSSQDELNSTLTTLLKKITEMADQEQKTAAQLPAPQPPVQPQPKYLTEDTLEEMLKKMAATKDIPVSQPQPQVQPQPKYLTEDAFGEMLKKLMEQDIPAPQPPVQPQPTPAPQPDFVTKADLDRKIEEMTASVTEAMKNAEKAATIRIDDSALEKIAELVAAKQAGSDAAPEKAKKSAK